MSVVGSRLGQALVRLRSVLRRRSDPVIVGTVYDPSDGTGDAQRVGLPRQSVHRMLRRLGLGSADES